MANVKKGKDGYGYKYADLASINDYLEERGITYYQIVDAFDGRDYIVTIPIIDAKEQPPRRGCRVPQATLTGKSNPAQELGSALTYARRYSVMMAFGLAGEDDDGASLSRYTDSRKEAKDRAEAMKKLNDLCSKRKITPERLCEANGLVWDASDMSLIHQMILSLER